jgi:hypothetical protein
VAVGQLEVELVIQTTTALLIHRLAPREAVTILATQGPRARAVAASFSEADPDRAGTYARLLTSIAADLRSELPETDDPRDLRAVVEDLERLVLALTA